MLEVTYILGKESIYLNLITHIAYGGQKRCIIEFITHNNTLNYLVTKMLNSVKSLYSMFVFFFKFKLWCANSI